MEVSLLALSLLPLVVPVPQACDVDGDQLLDGEANGAVALSGDTVVVNSGPGVAYAFVESGGIWSEEQQLSIPNTASAFALEGDTLLVGLPTNDDQAADAGAVYVYERAAGVWTLDDMLYASAPVTLDTFGESLAMEGDRAVISAPGRDVGGAVFVFERSGGVWSEVQEVEPDVPVLNGRFGNAVALSGDTFVATEMRGDAFAFTTSGGGMWTQQKRFDLPALDTNNIDVTAALSGDTAMFGHPLWGVFIFVRSGTVWTEEAVLPPRVPEITYVAVALEGDVAVVSMPSFLLGDAPVALFARAGTTWSHLADLTPAETNRGFGVAIDAERAATAGVDMFIGIGAENAHVYDLPDFVAPSVGYRNAGTNPDSYAASPGYVGGSLELTVDLNTTGHDMALVIGFDSPFGLTLGGGQTLLCFDLLGSGGELINTGFHPGPIAEIDLAVPNDLTLAGFSVCTQAVHAFGVVPFALSNAQDIVIGACL